MEPRIDDLFSLPHSDGSSLELMRGDNLPSARGNDGIVGPCCVPTAPYSFGPLSGMNALSPCNHVLSVRYASRFTEKEKSDEKRSLKLTQCCLDSRSRCGPWFLS